MRKIVFAIIFCIGASQTVSSQTVNNIPIKDIDVEYIQIVGTSRLLSKKVTIEIDFGQKSKYFSSGKETEIKDKDGKKMIFNSMIDSLNFMSSNGYEFVQAYAFAIGNQNIYHYLMRKKSPN